MVADPTNFNILFAGENSIGVLRSTNAGNSWTVSNSGMEAGTRFEIAVSPVNHNNVFVSGDVSETASKVYFSSDNGISWKRFNDSQNFLGGQGEYDNTIAAHPYNADEVYVGGVDMWKLKFNGAVTASAPLIKNCYPVNTDFLDIRKFWRKLFRRRNEFNRRQKYSCYRLGFGRNPLWTWINPKSPPVYSS